VCILAAAACAAPSDEPETIYDPCSPLHVAISPTVTPSERAGVEAAIASWAARLPAQLALQDGGKPADDVLPIVFEHGSGMRGAYWDAEGWISINSDELRAAEYPFAIAHEMGHAFGLPHVDASERVSVMNVGNTTIAPTEADAAAVAALWASCQP
jgi:hypothetical protein